MTSMKYKLELNRKIQKRIETKSGHKYNLKTDTGNR